MASALTIKSRMRNYDVCFVNDCAKAVGSRKATGDFLVIDQDLPASSKIVRLFNPDKIIYFKATEKTKTLEGCKKLIDALLSKNVRRSNIVVAVGGGVIEDAVAFVSLVLFRGLDWIFCPTTLLAQADSCIGSKSSINYGKYKNLLGSFYPPSRVIIDVGFLKTLPPGQVRSGIGEILHFFLVAGKDTLANQMMKRYVYFLENPCDLKPYILESLKVKKAVIERDEFDRGERNLFNYGHTFGHAIESVTNYRINHGQAVTRGMDLANYLSWKMKFIDEKTFDYLHGILAPNLASFKFAENVQEPYFQALSKDKKNLGSTLGCILTKGPGKMFRTQLEFNQELRQLIAAYFLTC